MPSSRKRELIEPTSSRNTVSRGTIGLPSHGYISDQQFFLSGSITGMKMERSLRKRMSGNKPKVGYSSRVVPRPDTISEAMEHSQERNCHDCLLKDPTSS